MIREFEFSSKSIEYLRDQLSGGNTLSRHLLNLPLERGRITSFLPESFEPAAHLSFRTGGVITTRLIGDERDSRILALISTALNKKGNIYAVFESIARVGDPKIAREGQYYFTFGREVYIFVDHTKYDTRTINEAVKDARFYPFVGVVASIPDDSPTIEPYQELGGDVITELAARAEHILTDIYDGEAFLIWSKVQS